MSTIPSPEDLERLLKATYALSEENNRILKEMRRIWRITFWSKVVIWLLVLILPLYLYSAFLAPWLSGATMMGIPSLEQIQALLEVYQGR